MSLKLLLVAMGALAIAALADILPLFTPPHFT